MRGRAFGPTWRDLEGGARTAAMLVMLAAWLQPALAAEDSEGKALLQKDCGRCHAIAAGEKSPLEKAPNLWTELRSYPVERLDFELAEGIGSRHEKMPQIQFSDEDITRIFYYLHGDAAGAEQPDPQ